jgi:AcrR family transcriptional regulator
VPAKKKKTIKFTTSNYHHGDLKQALLHAARKILQNNGLDALSLRSIAAEIGVSQMAPYSHFKSKNELLQMVAASGFDDLAECMMLVKKENQTAQGRNLATLYGAEYIKFAIENPALYTVMMSQVNTIGDILKNKIPNQENPLSLEKIRISTNKPFKLLHAAFLHSRAGKKLALARALGAWSTVHGMATLIIDGHLKIPDGMQAVDLFLAEVGRGR